SSKPPERPSLPAVRLALSPDEPSDEVPGRPALDGREGEPGSAAPGLVPGRPGSEAVEPELALGMPGIDDEEPELELGMPGIDDELELELLGMPGKDAEELELELEGLGRLGIDDDDELELGLGMLGIEDEELELELDELGMLGMEDDEEDELEELGMLGIDELELEEVLSQPASSRQRELAAKKGVQRKRAFILGILHPDSDGRSSSLGHRAAAGQRTEEAVPQRPSSCLYGKRST